MYFIDREKLTAHLKFINDICKDLKGMTSSETRLEQRALERMLHLLVEGFLDVGNQLIDGFIMRDPGSYEDIVDILVDEQVLKSSEKEGYMRLVAIRKMLVQNYLEVNLGELREDMSQYLTLWATFPAQVQAYLDSELGPVSAFKPTKD